MDLDRVGAVFEGVGDRDRLVGELALLADRHEAAGELVGDRAAEDEAPRLDACDLNDAPTRVGVHQRIHRPAERARVAEQRGDVAKQDARLGVVGNRADRFLQADVAAGFHGVRALVPGVMTRGL